MVPYREITMTKDVSLCENYPLIKRMFFSQFGLVLPKDLEASNKRKLLELKKNGPKKHTHFYNVTSDGEPLDEYLLALVEIFTVNHTSFFRIKNQFEFLKNIALPTLVEEFVKNNEKFKFRFWSAAAASGEEAYSVILTVSDFMKDCNLDVNTSILATDINISSLETAAKGAYKNHKIAGKLDPQHLDNLIMKADGNHQFSNEIRQKVETKFLNLNSKNYNLNKKFHVIFCRNILFYLSNDSRVRLAKNLLQQLEDGGYLFLGTSETQLIHSSSLVQVGPAIYRKRQ